jgi:hypothetical protein
MWRSVQGFCFLILYCKRGTMLTSLECCQLHG